MAEEDDLIFLGAAILLGSMLSRKPLEPDEIQSEIESAVVRAHLLRQKVKDERGKIRSGSEGRLGLLDWQKNKAGEKP